MPLAIALPLAEELLTAVKTMPELEKADVAGSLRRRRETIGDIDMLILSSDPRSALRAISRQARVGQVLGLGDTKATFLLEGGVQMDVRAVERECYGAALQYFTGSKEHNVHLRTIARDRGLKISEYGVFRGERSMAGRAEGEVYALRTCLSFRPNCGKTAVRSKPHGRINCPI